VLTTIEGVLDASQLRGVRELLDGAPFVDGRLSAGTAARRVKHNEEVAPGSGVVEALNRVVMGSLVQHPTYKAAALPYRVAVPYYARYTAGMAYGDHVDDPVMGPAGGRYRSDVSITVFLSGPEEYDGGELVVRTPFGPQSVKLPAGDAVLYPSSSLHRVAEVTGGQRLVAVTWVQSLVRDPQRRELLYELGLAREKLLRGQPGGEEGALVDRTYVNLVRMWADV
jgi:PKHD-type hydroxylase